MKKIKLYIACSLDGYIASIDGSLNWLTQYPMLTNQDYRFQTFIDTVDSVIMGGKTFRDILNMDFIYPYKDMMSYIITRNIESSTVLRNVEFIFTDIVNNILALKEIPGKDIWLVGGGETLAILLNNDLVDEMTITYIPSILGDGVPLFPKINKTSNWQLINTSSYDNGSLSIDYQKI